VQLEQLTWHGQSALAACDIAQALIHEMQRGSELRRAQATNRRRCERRHGSSPNRNDNSSASLWAPVRARRGSAGRARDSTYGDEREESLQKVELNTTGHRAMALRTQHARSGDAASSSPSARGRCVDAPEDNGVDKSFGATGPHPRLQAGRNATPGALGYGCC
jgi:hypothetical protein